MALVFLDTNLVIAILNPRERLHDNATKLAKNENTILLSSVKMETKSTFLRKFNTAMLEVYKILNAARKTENELQLQEVVVKEFKKLIKSQREYEAFYRYIFDEIQKFGIKRDSLLKIPTFLNERAVEITATILATKKETSLKADEKLQRKIADEIKYIGFKNFMDFDILCEALSIKTDEDIVFMTNDAEFYKKSKKALEILETKSILKNRKFEIKLVE